MNSTDSYMVDVAEGYLKLGNSAQRICLGFCSRILFIAEVSHKRDYCKPWADIMVVLAGVTVYMP